MSIRYIEIEQTHSPIRRHYNQRAILIGLGLNKIGRIAWVPDSATSRGMIRKVRHLVQINHDPAAPRLLAAPLVHDEAEDITLIRDLIFNPKEIVLEPYDTGALNRGKTPDFKLLKENELAGYCELKSPRDDFILETPEPGKVAIRKDVPFYRKLGRHICNAAAQLEAGNPEHNLPNILVFVSHTPEIERRDLRMTIEGIPVPGGKPLFMLSREMQEKVINAASKIDLFLWVNASDATFQYSTVANAKHRLSTLSLLELPE